MKIEKNRQILFYVSLIGIFVVSLIMGTTYAYQTLTVDYKEGSDSNTMVEAGKLNISYENTNKINIKNMTLLPNYKAADYTEFTIKSNDTSYDVAYEININNIEISESLINESFKYTITRIETDNEFIIGEGDFSNLSGNILNLKFNTDTYRILEKGKNETLRIYFWVNESNNVQNIEKSSFKGKIEIVSLFSNEINKSVYKSIKIYGNSVQDGEPSVENPVAIENLGSYDESVGKYKIPVRLNGKNFAHPNGMNFSSNGLTVVTNDDQTVTITGTANTATETILMWSGRKDKNNYWHDYIIYPGQKIKITVRNVETGKTTNQSEDSFSLGSQFKGLITGKTYYANGYLTAGEPVYFSRLYTQHTLTAGENRYAGTWRIQVEIGDVETDYEPYAEPVITNLYLDEPLRKVNNDSDYIDLVNGTIVRNVKVIDNTNTLLLQNSYAKLEVPTYESLDAHNFIYEPNKIISVCSDNYICSSNIEIEESK